MYFAEVRERERVKLETLIVFISSQKLVNILRKKTKMDRKKVDYLSSFQWHISMYIIY